MHSGTTSFQGHKSLQMPRICRASTWTMRPSHLRDLFYHQWKKKKNKSDQSNTSKYRKKSQTFFPMWDKYKVAQHIKACSHWHGGQNKSIVLSLWAYQRTNSSTQTSKISLKVAQCLTHRLSDRQNDGIRTWYGGRKDKWKGTISINIWSNALLFCSKDWKNTFHWTSVSKKLSKWWAWSLLSTQIRVHHNCVQVLLMSLLSNPTWLRHPVRKWKRKQRRVFTSQIQALSAFANPTPP